MTSADYVGPDAVKGLQRFHDKGEKVLENALKKLEGVILPEFYKKVAAEMQEEKATLKSLQKSFDTIILEQWVSMHLDHSGNGQYVPPWKGVYHRQGCVFLHGCAKSSPFLFCSQGHVQPQRVCCPEGDTWHIGLLAVT